MQGVLVLKSNSVLENISYFQTLGELLNFFANVGPTDTKKTFSSISSTGICFKSSFCEFSRFIVLWICFGVGFLTILQKLSFLFLVQSIWSH